MARSSNHPNLLVPAMLGLIVAIFVSGVAVGYLSARLKYKADLIETAFLVNQKSNKETIEKQLTAIQSLDGGVLMRNDKLYEVDDGLLEPLNDVTYFDDGSKIDVDGKVNRTDGSSFILADGQGIDSAGKLVIVDPEAK